MGRRGGNEPLHLLVHLLCQVRMLAQQVDWSMRIETHFICVHHVRIQYFFVVPRMTNLIARSNEFNSTFQSRRIGSKAAIGATACAFLGAQDRGDVTRLFRQAKSNHRRYFPSAEYVHHRTRNSLQRARTHRYFREEVVFL